MAERKDRQGLTGALFLLYQVIGGVLLLIALPVLLVFRRDELRERLGGSRARREPGSVWIHAASLGEFGAAWPLARAWADGDGGMPILFSCTNPVARKTITDRIPATHSVRLAPLDLWPLVARALSIERPRALVFVETEIWPAWILCAARRGIPLVLVSGRLSDRSFALYRLARFALGPILGRFAAIGCRTDEDRRRWIEIGADPARCHVWGNTKYDAGDATTSFRFPAPTHAARGPEQGRFLLVAGSIRPGEERILDLLADENDAGIRLIVAPRHLRTIAAVEAACVRRRISCGRYSLIGLDLVSDARGASRALRRERANQEESLPDVVILDLMGLLRAAYGIADAAFVGGTWGAIGGHNLFEPALLGVPVFFGPSISGVRDAAEALIAHGGGKLVKDPAELRAELAAVRGHAEDLVRMGCAARAAAEALAGGVGRTIEALRAIHFPPGPDRS